MTQPPEPGVHIGLTQIYEKLLSVENAVTGLPARVHDLESKVDALVMKVYLMAGSSGVIGTIVGALVSKNLK